jgi:hypothetical protein
MKSKYSDISSRISALTALNHHSQSGPRSFYPIWQLQLCRIATAGCLNVATLLPSSTIKLVRLVEVADREFRVRVLVCGRRLEFDNSAECRA